MRQSTLRGAVYGLFAWLVYGIVEFALTAVIVKFFRPETEIVSWQWRLIGQLWGVYALGGVVLGAAGGALLAAAGQRGLKDGAQIMAGLTLVVAFLANLAPAWPLARSENIAAAVALLLGAALVAALGSDVWRKRMLFLANPWAVSLLLLSGPWISREALGDRSAGLKLGASLLALAVVVAVAALSHYRRSGRVAALGRQVMNAAAVMGVLAAVIWFAGRTPSVSADQSPGAPGRDKPNILLITMDTVRADHLSLYGYQRNTSPNLQDLARESTVYSRAIATADFTLPTHASIFTGLYPSWHGASFAPPEYPLGRPLSSSAVTLAEVLRSHGYRTAAVVANYSFLHPSLGLDKGFSEYDSHRPVFLARSNFARPFYLREGARTLLSLAIDVSAYDSIAFRAEDVNRHATALLEEGRPGVPFFLFLNYMDAHRPYAPPPPFNTKFQGEGPHFGMRQYEDLKDAVLRQTRRLSDSEQQQLISLYDGGIAYLDASIGSFLDRLRRKGLYENTLIIVTSDHGEAFGEHHLMEHAVSSVYQDQVHIPLLVKYPGQHQARRSDAFASQVDLLPTVLDLAGIEPPAAIQGQTLRSNHEGGEGTVYSEATTTPTLYGVNPRFRGARRAIFSGSSKLISWTQGPEELYDLTADPEERHNLFRRNDSAAEALAARLAGWVATIPRKMAQPPKLDKFSVERLRSLGYAQ